MFSLKQPLPWRKERLPLYAQIAPAGCLSLIVQPAGHCLLYLMQTACQKPALLPHLGQMSFCTPLFIQVFQQDSSCLFFCAFLHALSASGSSPSACPAFSTFLSFLRSEKAVLPDAFHAAWQTTAWKYALYQQEYENYIFVLFSKCRFYAWRKAGRTTSRRL